MKLTSLCNCYRACPRVWKVMASIAVGLYKVLFAKYMTDIKEQE